MKELRAGKGYVHEHRDLAGRPVMVAIARRHSIFERDLLESSRMCTWMLETALKRLSMAEPPKKPAQEPEGPPEQALGIFDLRGFSPLQADLEVAGFLIEALYNYYPGRTGKVLLVGAPELFKAFWDNIKPLLGKYSKLADFVTVDELRENYFKPGLEPPEFRKDSSGVPALAVKTCVGSAALASLAFAGATAWSARKRGRTARGASLVGWAELMSQFCQKHSKVTNEVIPRLNPRMKPHDVSSHSRCHSISHTYYNSYECCAVA